MFIVPIDPMEHPANVGIGLFGEDFLVTTVFVFTVDTIWGTCCCSNWLAARSNLLSSCSLSLHRKSRISKSGTLGGSWWFLSAGDTGTRAFEMSWSGEFVGGGGAWITVIGLSCCCFSLIIWTWFGWRSEYVSDIPIINFSSLFTFW